MPSPRNSTSAAAGGASAALAHVARAGGTHLGAAGEAERAVDRGAAALLKELSLGVRSLRVRRDSFLGDARFPRNLGLGRGLDDPLGRVSGLFAELTSTHPELAL